MPPRRIDDALRRQLRVRLSVPPGVYPASLRGCLAHRHLAREAACQSIVLLRHDHAVLPLQGLRSLAVIGRLAAEPNLGDRGSSDTRPDPGAVITPWPGKASSIWWLSSLAASRTDVTPSRRFNAGNNRSWR